MGMSKQFRAKANREIKQMCRYEPWGVSAMAVALVQRADKSLQELIKNSKHSLNAGIVRSLVFSTIKYFHITSKLSNKADQIEKVNADRYVGIDDDGVALFDDIRVSRFFLPTLEKWNAAREQRDRDEIALRQYVLEIESRVYVSRTFPVKLRALIFERDGYCCTHCGRHIAELRRVGSHLEADHIVAWEDGGLTCYQNGQTLCRDCNIGKHAIKRVQYARNVLRDHRPH